MSARSPMVATDLKPTSRRIELFSDAVFGIACPGRDANS